MQLHMDWVNVGTLLAILFGNLIIIMWLLKSGQDERAKDVACAHAFWTGSWFFWLCAWYAYYHEVNAVIVDGLDDLGSISLIGFSIAYMSGRQRLKDVWWGLVILAVVVGAHLMIASAALDWKVSSSSTAVGVVVSARTLLFGPSLCLVVFALGLVAWSFLQRFEQWGWSAAIAFMALIYAVFQVYIFQAILFSPAVPTHDWWRNVFVGWRVGFVLLYWVLVLASSGIQVRWKPAWAGLSGAVPIVTTVIEWFRK